MCVVNIQCICFVNFCGGSYRLHYSVFLSGGVGLLFNALFREYINSFHVFVLRVNNALFVDHDCIFNNTTLFLAHRMRRHSSPSSSGMRWPFQKPSGGGASSVHRRAPCPSAPQTEQECGWTEFADICYRIVDCV